AVSVCGCARRQVVRLSALTTATSAGGSFTTSDGEMMTRTGVTPTCRAMARDRHMAARRPSLDAACREFVRAPVALQTRPATPTLPLRFFVLRANTPPGPITR